MRECQRGSWEAVRPRSIPVAPWRRLVSSPGASVVLKMDFLDRAQKRSHERMEELSTRQPPPAFHRSPLGFAGALLPFAQSSPAQLGGRPGSRARGDARRGRCGRSKAAGRRAGRAARRGSSAVHHLCQHRRAFRGNGLALIAEKYPNILHLV